jgi:CubicO group peptidase (beta-lactamase class C family)
MNNFLIQQEGRTADIFNMVRDEVYIPLGLSAGALTTLRTDNSPSGTPFGGYGLFWTHDDIAKIALFINNQNGNLDGYQLLEPTLLSMTLQRNSEIRGLNTTGYPVFKYKDGFWAKEWTGRQYSCSFWTPFMSGFGGITVVLMPNGAIYYYFSDGNEFSWYEAVDEANKIKPMCP